MSDHNLKLLPIRFDPQTFADQQTTLNGLIAVKAMQRLQTSIMSSEAMVSTKLSFSRGLYGYPFVRGVAHADVTVRCERCLDQVNISLDPVIEVLVKPTEEDLPNQLAPNEESPDIHEYAGNLLTLSDLIEEELLLVMPLVPRHEDISLCNQDMVAWLASNEGPKAEAKRAENPFAILKR